MVSVMNNQMITYTVMKNYVMGNWELTFISLKGGIYGQFNIEKEFLVFSKFLNSHYFQMYFTFYLVKIRLSVPVLQLIKVNCTTQANSSSYVSYCFPSSYIFFYFIVFSSSDFQENTKID